MAESDLFGLRGYPTKEQAYTYMSMRMPTLRRFILNRGVAERIDLSSNAKVVFAVLSSFTTHPRLYMAEIAGLCGLCPQTVNVALKELERYGLIRIKANYYSANRRGPSTFIRLPYAERFCQPSIPKIFQHSLDNLEERVNARFKL